MNLGEVDNLHVLAEISEAKRVTVEYAELEVFSRLLSRFISSLGEDAADSYWEAPIRAMKRARWLAATLPLPLFHQDAGIVAAHEIASPRLRRVGEIAPELAAQALRLVDLLETLAGSNANPLGDKLTEQLTDDATAATQRAVLLTSGRGRDAVNAYLRSAGLAEVEAITETEFTRRGTWESVVAIGCVNWFRPHIVRAPRSVEMLFVYFGWIRDPELERAFLMGANSMPVSAIAEPAATHALESLVVDDWKPTTDWAAIDKSLGDESDTSDPVEAWMFVLASGDAVFLESAEGSRVNTVNVDESFEVRQHQTAEILVGDYLVVRTAGDGDYIAEMADKLLRARASTLRGLQASWKSALARIEAQYGIEELRARLQAAGATHAEEPNIRRWIRRDSIKTRAPEDFAAIMTVIGEATRTHEFWAAMEEIDSAHRRAGARVRKLLLEEIEAGDTSLLIERGWADFDVAEIEGEGSLRVARLDEKNPEKQLVARWKTRRLFPLGDDLWLG